MFGLVWLVVKYKFLVISHRSLLITFTLICILSLYKMMIKILSAQTFYLIHYSKATFLLKKSKETATAY